MKRLRARWSRRSEDGDETRRDGDWCSGCHSPSRAEQSPQCDIWSVGGAVTPVGSLLFRCGWRSSSLQMLVSVGRDPGFGHRVFWLTLLEQISQYVKLRENEQNLKQKHVHWPDVAPVERDKTPRCTVIVQGHKAHSCLWKWGTEMS